MVSVDEAVSTGPGRDHTPPARRFGGRGRSVLEVALLAVLAVVMLFPALWMIETSIKENRDVYAIPAKFFDFTVTLDHFKDVFVASGGRSALSVSFLNSVVVAGVSTALATGLPLPPNSDVPPRTTAATEGSSRESPWNAPGVVTTPARSMPAVAYSSEDHTYAPN